MSDNLGLQSAVVTEVSTTLGDSNSQTDSGLDARRESQRRGIEVAQRCVHTEIFVTFMRTLFGNHHG
jgi:hypothetical protein